MYMVQNLPTKILDEYPIYSLKGKNYLKINRIDPRLRILKVQKQYLIMPKAPGSLLRADPVQSNFKTFQKL